MTPVRVLFTGSAGFVGRSVLDAALLEHPEWIFTALDLQSDDHWPDKWAQVQYVRADVREYEDCVRAIEIAKPNVVVHSAGVVPQGVARYSQYGRDHAQAVNVTGTANMVKASRACGVLNFIQTGSYTAITDDLDHDFSNMNEEIPIPTRLLIYGESKAMAEKIVLEANNDKMATCVLRPSVILGRDDYQLLPSIHGCIENGQTPYLIGNGDNLYDFTFVDNVAQAHVLAIENLVSSRTAAGQAINISNGQPVTFRDFMLAIWAQFDHTPPFTVRIPAGVAGFAGYVAEWHSWFTGSKTTLCRGSVKDAIGVRYASQEKAKQILGYHPKVDLWDAVTISCEAFKIRLNREKQRSLK